MSGEILIFGDICPDNGYREVFDKGELIFSEDILKKIDEADYVVCNLECPATDKTNPLIKCGPNLRAKPDDIRLFAEMGINAVSLANNHVLDYGKEGFIDTLNSCEDNGLEFFGAGKNAKEASKPLILSLNGKKIGFLSFAEEEFNGSSEYGPGANVFDPYYSYDSILNLKQMVDIVVVLYHGGIEHYRYPSPLLQKKCRKMVEVGADLVLCQHSHCIGTIEKYKNKTILYGQGNSVFGHKNGNTMWDEGLLVEINVFTLEIKFYLMKAKPKQVVFADKNETDSRINLLYSQSKILNDSKQIETLWLKFVYEKRALYYSLLTGRNRLFNKLNRLMKNRLIDVLYRKREQMITMNVLRCDAHREVILTMLEEKIYGKKFD